MSTSGALKAEAALAGFSSIVSTVFIEDRDSTGVLANTVYVLSAPGVDHRAWFASLHCGHSILVIIDADLSRLTLAPCYICVAQDGNPPGSVGAYRESKRALRWLIAGLKKSP